MESSDVYASLGRLGVIPVVAIEDAGSALQLADALIAGGLGVAEITFRTAAAGQAMETLKSERPDLLVGAGTILNIDDLRRAWDCGAAFGVAPGFNPKIVAEACELGFPFAPGVMTPSDVEGALEMGLNVLKYFPAEAAGGAKLLKSLAAPYAHLGVKFIPTGGINVGNAPTYLESPAVLAVGGSWVAKRSDIAEGNWDTIEANARAVVDMVSSLSR